MLLEKEFLIQEYSPECLSGDGHAPLLASGILYSLKQFLIMLEVKGKALISAINDLATIYGYIAASEQAGKSVLFPVNGQEYIVERIKNLLEQLRKMNLILSCAAAERTLRVIEDRVQKERIRSSIEHLLTVISDELESIGLLAISNEKKLYFDLKKPDIGADVFKNFPSIESEVAEARKCYALGRPTACVFHSMRILEIGLCTLAKALDVEHERRNWNELIEGIEKQIRANGRKYGRDKEQFYSECASGFWMFKNAWRNHVMHVRDSYPEDRAVEILNNVLSFISQLSKELREGI